MSAQVAKSSGTPGRRTSLSLSAQKQNKSKALDIDKDTKQIPSKNEAERGKELKFSNNQQKSKESAAESVAKKDDNQKSENGTGGNKQHVAAANGHNNKTEETKQKHTNEKSDPKKKELREKSNQQNQLKQKDENAEKNIEDKSKVNNKDENKVKPDGRNKKESAGTPKNVITPVEKSGTEIQKKMITKELPVAEKEVVIETPVEKPEKNLEQNAVKESSVSMTKKQNEEDIQKTVSEVNDEIEMEALVVEPDNENLSSENAVGMVLKLKQIPPTSSTPPSLTRPSQKNISPRKIQEHIEPPTTRFLERSHFSGNTVIDSAPSLTSLSSGLGDRPNMSSLRAISGRRSLRSTREYSFQNTATYKESYRKINTEFDNTASSMNVTVGSEIPNESTLSFFGRGGKKRERTPPQLLRHFEEQSDDIEMSPRSPKRARLDFTGIFGFVSSPVSMLRARLSRTKIQSSTPNCKITQKPKEEEEGVENVSVIEADDVVDNEIIDNDDDIKLLEPEENLDLSKEKKIDCEILDKLLEDATEAVEKVYEDVSMTTNNVGRRKMCNIM